ncbi:MAG: hypothetical protein ABIV25_10710 [Paracoccaceae bacterium]
MNALSSDIEEFVTIIAESSADAMQQYKAQGLAQLGFAIVGRIGPNRFSLATGNKAFELFEGQKMIAATFSRRVSAEGIN